MQLSVYSNQICFVNMYIRERGMSFEFTFEINSG